MSEQCLNITANPDVSGIGIRVNLYTTTLLLAVIPKTPYTESLLSTLVNNAGISGLGLLITAIIQTAQKDLSLYHAIFILHILFFLGLSVAPAGKYRWGTLRLAMTVILSLAALIALLSWGLYLWVHAPVFGSQPACNNAVKYVFFFVSVRATVPWLRKLWMATLIIVATGTGILVNVNVILFAWVGASRVTPAARSTSGTGFSDAVSYISFPLLFSAVYSVVMLELTVKRNQHLVQSGEGVWSFGQILSLVMILSNLNEVMHFLLSLRYSGSSSDDDQSDWQVAVGDDGRSAQAHVPSKRLWNLPAWLGSKDEKKNAEQSDLDHRATASMEQGIQTISAA